MSGADLPNLTPYFLRGIKKNQNFHEALQIVQANSLRRIWVIGGTVYRTIAHELYDWPLSHNYDYDFIVEQPRAIISLPRNWSQKNTLLGSPRLICGTRQIDFIPLAEAARSATGTIADYFRRVPFTFQAIAYDVSTSQVIGQTGITALLGQKLAINNSIELRSYLERCARVRNNLLSVLCPARVF